VGMTSMPDGGGYRLVAADGGVFAFGDAAFRGSLGGNPPDTPVVGMATTADGTGYWLANTDSPVPAPGRVPSVLGHCNDPAIGPSVKPATIVLACGDGNASLTDLTWSSWTAVSATGRGRYVHNTCSPDCAHGTFVSASATVRLGYPIETGAGEEFAQISYTTPAPNAPGQSTTSTVVAATSPG